MEIIYKLLESDDERLEKRGLQQLCELLEKKIFFDQLSKQRLLAAISKLQRSEYVLVRRWLYKAIGLLKERMFVGYLIGQIKLENDEENKTWIVAALFNITTKEEAIKKIYSANLTDKPSMLSAAYFEPSLLPNESIQIKKILDSNDPLSLKWLGLLYGNSFAEFIVPKSKMVDYISQLNLHDDINVVEYSIWALHKSPNSFADCLINPQDIPGKPANIRRWLYRLITKDLDTVFGYFDLISSAINQERDIAAREGLAMGLSRFADTPQLNKLLVEWFQKERNSIVRMQLLQAFAHHGKKIKEYQSILRNEYHEPFDDISRAVAFDAIASILPHEIKQPEINFEMNHSKIILLVVATLTELKVILSLFDKKDAKSKSDFTYWELGSKKNYTLLLVKTGMGSSAADGSTLTISDAIEHLSPNYIIMVGIAFGLKPDKQKLEEVIVSKQLQGYELARLSENCVIPRGDKISVAPGLISKFENASVIWEQKVHFGLIVSGEKLIDNKSEIEKLKQSFPEAIGGEMEGAGMLAAAHRKKTDWVLIKGICDWGYDKDDKHQVAAMENAASFLMFVLEKIDF